MQGLRRSVLQLCTRTAVLNSWQPLSSPGASLCLRCMALSVPTPWPACPPSSSTSSAWPLAAAQQRSIFTSFTAVAPKKYSQRRLVGWTPEQLYNVVSDVDQYQHFVPWCQKSTVIKRAPDGNYMEAELEVGFQVLVERYVSKVSMQKPRVVRSMVQNSMLFHHLDSHWTMEPGPSPGTCWLSFKVDFAFNNALYSHLADMFFTEVVQRMIGAFETRCLHLYGPSSLTAGQRLAAGRQGQRPAVSRPPQASQAACPTNRLTQQQQQQQACRPAAGLPHAGEPELAGPLQKS